MPKDNQIDRPKVFLDRQPRPFTYTIQFSETNSISNIRTVWNDSAFNFNITFMMKMELVSEKLDSIIHLKWLSAQDEFIVFFHRDNLRYMTPNVLDTAEKKHLKFNHTYGPFEGLHFTKEREYFACHIKIHAYRNFLNCWVKEFK
jgi:hypothetical protein